MVLPLVLFEGRGEAITFGIGCVLVAGTFFVVRHAARAVAAPRLRGSMIASGLAVTVVLALPAFLPVGNSGFLPLDLIFLPAFVMSGLVFGLSYLVVDLIPGGALWPVQAGALLVFAAAYWLVATAVLGFTIAACRWTRPVA